MCLVPVAYGTCVTVVVRERVCDVFKGEGSAAATATTDI